MKHNGPHLLDPLPVVGQSHRWEMGEGLRSTCRAEQQNGVLEREGVAAVCRGEDHHPPFDLHADFLRAETREDLRP